MTDTVHDPVAGNAAARLGRPGGRGVRAHRGLPAAPAPAARRGRHPRPRCRGQGVGRPPRCGVPPRLRPATPDERAPRPTPPCWTLPSGERLAFSTDSYVVKPLRFPGGSVGHLAVHGTINDLAMMGARPIGDLGRLRARGGLPHRRAPRGGGRHGRGRGRRGRARRHGRHQGGRPRRGRRHVHHDGRGGPDPRRPRAGGRQVAVGDVVLASGTMGDHGTAVMLARGDLALEADIVSDTAPLHELVEDLLAAAPDTRWLRDSTRGGVGTVCNELARDADLTVVLEESSLPVRPAVAAACELLGIDPLYVANEGKLVAVVPPEQADAALAAMRAHPLGVRGRAGGRHPRRAARDRRAADRLGRHPDRRHARRRPAATHLLTGRRPRRPEVLTTASSGRASARGCPRWRATPIRGSPGRCWPPSTAGRCPTSRSRR